MKYGYIRDALSNGESIEKQKDALTELGVENFIIESSQEKVKKQDAAENLVYHGKVQAVLSAQGALHDQASFLG